MRRRATAKITAKTKPYITCDTQYINNRAEIHPRNIVSMSWIYKLEGDPSQMFTATFNPDSRFKKQTYDQKAKRTAIANCIANLTFDYVMPHMWYTIHIHKNLEMHPPQCLGLTHDKASHRKLDSKI